jgi:hypothetical protein
MRVVRAVAEYTVAMATLSVQIDDQLLERTREMAARRCGSLEAYVCETLEQALAGTPTQTGADYLQMMERLSYARSAGPYTRDEMNER